MRLLIITFSSLLLYGVGCNILCKHKIRFGLIYANKDDTLKVFVDKKLIADKIIKESYTGYFHDKRGKLSVICAENDSMLVTILFNSQDTSFYIKPKEIKECYIGNSMKDSIHVYYNHVVGGFGKYDPKR